jgi:hypothetical protein
MYELVTKNTDSRVQDVDWKLEALQWHHKWATLNSRDAGHENILKMSALRLCTRGSLIENPWKVNFNAA